ncbi:MAG: diacylglycerol kinase [Clostridia bacterium BRH_c25]|nr:MAG: diacylglycerol kinase [Clostridia bacterium BRH_c25]
MRYLFILNPGSKGGESRKRFDRIFEILASQGIAYDYKVTSTLDEAYNLSVEGNRSGYDVIAAVGGDGTINKVLNGFFDEQGNRLSNARMGVVYTGTSPDFCKSYNIPLKLEAAIRVLLENKCRRIQVGRICLANTCRNEYDNGPVDESGYFDVRYFACCANIGLGAELARRANSGIRKQWGDFLGTLFSLVNILASYKPQDFMLCINGAGKKVEKVHNISIGRTFHIASGIKVRNTLKQEDNRFYMLTVRNLRVKDWIKAIKIIYSGKQIENNDIISLDYVESIEVYGNSRSPEIEFDGDPAGFLPCRIEAARCTLDLICGMGERCEG